MENFVFDNGIKRIAVNDPDGNLITELKINVADARTSEKFANLIDNLNNIASECTKEAQELSKKYEGRPIMADSVDTEQIIDVSTVKIKYLMRMADGIDDLFGKNTVRNVFKDAYELDPDFVPDEDALVDFVSKMIPIMNSLFGKRFDKLREKYSSRRRGKHNKNKKELIQGYKDQRNE